LRETIFNFKFNSTKINLCPLYEMKSRDSSIHS